MFHHYLVGTQFLLQTDHGALCWLFGMKNLEGQPARWVKRLGCYNMVIRHRPGKAHGNADRCPDRCPDRCHEPQMEPGSYGTELNFHDFQTTRYFTEIHQFEEHEASRLDGNWSDDQWEDDEPLTAEEIAAGEPAYPEHNDVLCVCRVRTRAQTRMAYDNSDDEDSLGARPPDPQAAASPPRARWKKIARTASSTAHGRFC